MCKKMPKNLLNSRKTTTFAPAFKKSKHWRDGRVVDYSSLENYRTERYRGFESLSLRKEFSRLAELFLFWRFSYFPLPTIFEMSSIMPLPLII